MRVRERCFSPGINLEERLISRSITTLNPNLLQFQPNLNCEVGCLPWLEFVENNGRGGN